MEPIKVGILGTIPLGVDEKLFSNALNFVNDKESKTKCSIGFVCGGLIKKGVIKTFHSDTNINDSFELFQQYYGKTITCCYIFVTYDKMITLYENMNKTFGKENNNKCDMFKLDFIEAFCLFKNL